MSILSDMRYPHWLMVAGALLVIVGLIGWLISRRQMEAAQDDPDGQPSQEARPQMPPLPDLLDTRPKNRHPSTRSGDRSEEISD
ncbi:hypothetical protein [Bradyrhizobium sp. B117]|uniref:hypothetical protein n=1 Tax=Bradyrhizobium sp. B117 TaxID=3140246 RepID=UPI0031841C17